MSEEDALENHTSEYIIFSHPTLRKESLVSGRYPTDSEKFPERQKPLGRSLSWLKSSI